jgi:serine/threonine-protein kinase RIM15
VDDKDAFQRAVETMKNDDSRSYKLRFAVAMGSMSKLSKDSTAAQSSPSSSSEVEAFQMDEILEQQTTLTLEGQGILIYDRSTGEPSHVSSSQRYASVV